MHNSVNLALARVGSESCVSNPALRSAVQRPLREGLCYGLCDVLAPYPVALVVRVDPVDGPVAVRGPPGVRASKGLGLGVGAGPGIGGYG